MRGSSICMLGKQCRKKIDHYFQNKKIYLGGGGDGWKACTCSIYKVHPSGTALLYCSVNEHYWTGASPLTFALVWLKDTESWLQQQKQQNPASLQLQPLYWDHFNWCGKYALCTCRGSAIRNTSGC